MSSRGVSVSSTFRLVNKKIQEKLLVNGFLFSYHYRPRQPRAVRVQILDDFFAVAAAPVDRLNLRRGLRLFFIRRHHLLCTDIIYHQGVDPQVDNRLTFSLSPKRLT